MPAYNKFTEEQLMERLRSGDEHAFTEIYNRYWEKLLAIAYYYSHDKQTSEDIVHEVMLGLWMRKAGLLIHSLPAYLATAVKFAVFKVIAREKKRRELLEGRVSGEHIDNIEEKLDARFLQEYLHGSLEELPAKTRLVFSYSRYNELSVSDIARKMDLSPKAVEYHITKALRALRDSLQKLKSFFI